jgi:hypothetical protein
MFTKLVFWMFCLDHYPLWVRKIGWSVENRYCTCPKIIQLEYYVAVVTINKLQKDGSTSTSMVLNAKLLPSGNLP